MKVLFHIPNLNEKVFYFFYESRNPCEAIWVIELIKCYKACFTTPETEKMTNV